MKDTTRVFLDASVLVAATGSPSGGSSAAIDVLAAVDEYRATVSRNVLDEARRNVGKLRSGGILRLHRLLADLDPLITDPANFTGALDMPSAIAAKDHHVIQACMASAASICLTLDRRHLLTGEVRRWAETRGLRILSPAEFLEEERRRDAGHT